MRSETSLSLMKSRSATRLLNDSFEVVLDSKFLGPDAGDHRGLTAADEQVELRTPVANRKHYSWAFISAFTPQQVTSSWKTVR